MKVLISYLLVVVVLLNFCPVNVAVGEEQRDMNFIERLFHGFSIESWLERRGILTEDKEAFEMLLPFLEAAQNDDIPAMRALFAPRAIAEIGEEHLEQMLNDFVGYYHGGSAEVEVPIGPQTSEYIEGNLKRKELKAPFDVITSENEYRMAIRCIPRDDMDNTNIGIWSVYILERSKDTDQEHAYRGDKQYRTGVYIDIMRPE